MSDESDDLIWKVTAEPNDWAGLAADALLSSDWSKIPALPAFVRSDGSADATFQTTVRLVASGKRLCVLFECDDPDIWATMTDRDDPLYEEEVIEVFLAAGDADPKNYFEFEVSPDGVLFDATISNPDSDRATMTGDASWNCPGIDWGAKRWDAESRWSAVLAIPWGGLGQDSDLRPQHWRANFFRIERPCGKAPEYSCWKPTMVSPADFHKPACFGHLLLPQLEHER
ncbi:MAG: carbohydrate-binding family 9-like protein [Verrucomicrobiales bacterium]